jgi:hypothetical protein
VRNVAGGQLFCEPCFAAWQNFQTPFMAPSSGPNPSAAAVLGLVPGVGAMYNGQFFKGLIHVVIFAVLVSITHHYGIFGIFIAAWILYQSFEAFHTAKARRDGQPLPDPLGLNELGAWLNLGSNARPPYPGQSTGPAPWQGQANPGAFGAGAPGQGPATGAYQTPYSGQYQAPFEPGYGAPFTPPAAGFVDPAVPPVPPVPPVYWRRKEPMGAIILIGLGLLFLLGQLDLFNGRMMEFAWPVALIGLGVFLIVRRLGDSQGGPK